MYNMCIHHALCFLSSCSHNVFVLIYISSVCVECMLYDCCYCRFDVDKELEKIEKDESEAGERASKPLLNFPTTDVTPAQGMQLL